jgi:hypothetical protein
LAGLSVIAELEQFHPAVVGAISRGKKDVGSNEFMATLIALARQGALCIEYDDAGEGIALRIEDAGTRGVQKPGNPIDAQAIALLDSFFAEGGGLVSLASAKSLGQAQAAELDAAYKAWKRTVKQQAADSVSASKSSLMLQRGLLYAGYIAVVLCALSGYLFDLLVGGVFLIAGAALIITSLVMQRRISVEKQKISELFQSLNGLASYVGDVKADREYILRLLEYAWLFGIEQKVVKALLDTSATDVVSVELPALRFWKHLRAELYTTEQ